jgi:SAM-dependent methyltransferase
MRRKVDSELLDSDCGTPAEIAAALADLRRVNRWFGGVSTSERLVQRVVDESALRRLELLDVASGSGDVPLAVASRFERRGVHLHLTLLDRWATHLPCVPAAIVGDALHLPFPPQSFDLVTCSLFVHHLEPAPLKHFVREALRVARIALVINDLVRSRLHLALVVAARPLFRSRMAWRDGVVSIRRAYTEQELRVLLMETGRRVEFSRHYLQRVGVIVWK